MKPNLKLLLAAAAVVGSAVAVAQDAQQPPSPAPPTPTLAAANTPAPEATPAPPTPDQRPLGERHWRHHFNADGAPGQNAANPADGQRPPDGQKPEDGQRPPNPGSPGEHHERFRHFEGGWQEGWRDGNRGHDGPEGAGHFQHPPLPPAKPVPYIGVITGPVPEILATQLGLPKDFGLVVEGVLPNSPAATAGLQRYDVLKLYNDQQIVDPRQLQILVRATGKDGSATLTVIRKAQEQKITVKIGERVLADAGMHGFHHPQGAEQGPGEHRYAQAGAGHGAEHHPAEQPGDKQQGPGRPEFGHQQFAGHHGEHHGPEQERFSRNGFEHHHSFDREESRHHGFGHHGFGREGFGRQSSEHHGFGHHGHEGFDGQGSHHHGFGHHGFGREGFGRQSSEHHGFGHHGHEGFDGQGSRQHGFGHHGFGREGFGRQSSEHHGFGHHDHEGFDGQGSRQHGFGHHGFGREGFGRQSSEHHGFGHHGHEGFDGQGFRHHGFGHRGGERQQAPFDRSGRQPAPNRGPGSEHRNHDLQSRPEGWHQRSSDVEESSELPPVEPANLLREIRPGGAAQIRVEHPDGSVVYDTANAKVLFTDATGRIEIAMKDGHRTLLATNTQGETVFEGPIETPEQLNNVPEDIRKKIDWIEARTQSELVAAPAPAAPLQGELVQPELADALVQ